MSVKFDWSNLDPMLRNPPPPPPKTLNWWQRVLAGLGAAVSVVAAAILVSLIVGQPIWKVVASVAIFSLGCIVGVGLLFLVIGLAHAAIKGRWE